MNLNGRLEMMHMATISARLTALEQRPQSKIPVFRVRFEDDSEQIAHGFELLRLTDAKIIHYDSRQPCVAEVVGLYAALNPCVEVMADG